MVQGVGRRRRKYLRHFLVDPKWDVKTKTCKTTQDQEVARLTFINSIYKVFIIFILDELVGAGGSRGGGRGEAQGCWVGVEEEGRRVVALSEGNITFCVSRLCLRL